MKQAEVEAAVRRYLSKTLGRYVPLGIVLLAVVLIVAFVPTVEPASTRFAAQTPTPGSFASGAPGTPAGGSVAGSGTSASGGFGGSASPTGSSAGAGAGAGAGAPLPVPSGITPPAAQGTSKTGVACGGGARQFAWSPYAPACVPAYAGSNGGATAPGVTGSTITVTYRIPNSAQQSAINALAGAANVNDGAYRSDLQSYINYFNTQFELYGRHVVLKTYQGQGDYLEEDQGQNLGAAQADAVTAHDLGAFGDVTFPLYSSQYYMQDLASERVVAFGGVYLPNSWFQQYAPYEYSVYSPTGDSGGLGAAQAICHRAAGLPAIFTNDPLFSHETRTFGLILPENAVYQQTGNLIQQTLAACGVKLLKRIAYQINVATFENQAVSMVAQMKAAGVTSVLCACDPLVPIFISQAADQQGYFPEWFAQWWGDPATRNFAQDQWDHAVSTTGLQFPANKTTEAYKAFQQAQPGKIPAEWPPASPPYFYVPYYALLQLFDGLQAAGPNLNATTFAQGMFSLPPSLPGGLTGMWRPGSGVYDPLSQFTITRWNANAISQFDNTKGAWVACNGGALYDFTNPNSLGGPHVQSSCPPGN